MRYACIAVPKYELIEHALQKLKLASSFNMHFGALETLLAEMNEGKHDEVLGVDPKDSGMNACPFAIMGEKLVEGSSSIEREAQAREKFDKKKTAQEVASVCRMG